MFHLTQPQFQDQAVRCALVQAIDRQDLVDVVYGGFGNVASGPFSPGQDGYLDDAGLPAYDPEAAAAAIADWEAANGPAGRSTTRRRRPAPTRRSPTTCRARGARSASTSPRRPIEQSKLITNALLGSPEFDAFGWRNHAGLVRRHPDRLVARLRRRRLRRRGQGRRRRPQLRPPQRPGHQRPARPGPLGDRPGRPQGAGPADQPGVRQAVLDPAALVDDVGHHHGSRRSRTSAAPRCPTARAPSSTAPASPARSG